MFSGQGDATRHSTTEGKLRPSGRHGRLGGTNRQRHRTLPVAAGWGAWLALAAVLAGGVALAWACRHYPARLPFLAPWDFSWPEYIAAAAGLGLYARGMRLAGPALWPSRARRGCFIAGVLLCYGVLQTRFDYLAQHMFALTRVQHLVTHHLGPFLIALSAPGEMLGRGMPPTLRRLSRARAAERVVAALQQPVVAGLLFVGLIFLWLIPSLQFRAMIDRRLYDVMNWSMLLDGLLFWALVLDRRPCPPARLSHGARVLLLFGVQFPQIVGGAIIGFADTALYPYYALCGRVFPAISSGADQQIGGTIIGFGGGMMSAIAVLIMLHATWREDERSAAQACAAARMARGTVGSS